MLEVAGFIASAASGAWLARLGGEAVLGAIAGIEGSVGAGGAIAAGAGAGALGDYGASLVAAKIAAEAIGGDSVAANCVTKNSFSGDTPVLMADGSAKRIDQVKVGDQVANAEPDDSSIQQHAVTALHITDDDHDFVDVTVRTSDGLRTIVTTAHHPFWDAARHAWTDAAALTAGDQLSTPGNGRIVVQRLKRYYAAEPTYNLTVDVVHTYYVLAGHSPVLVHNSGPNCGIPIGGKNGNYLGEETFHGSEYTLDEITQFVVGHTGGNNPAMGRPSVVEIETTLRRAGPQQLEGQNSSRFDYDGVRVIVNWTMPWKSMAYYPGR